MPNSVYVMEAANLFCGDADPSRSNHLTITDLKLPTLEENYVDHVPGGAPVAMEIDTHINRLEATFNLAGWSPEVMVMIGNSERANQVFTAYGVIRDRRTGIAMEGKAILGGRLGRVNPQSWRRGDLQHHEYSIRSIVHYELYLDGGEIYSWDFFLNQRRIGGVDLNFDINRILRIPITP
jgi:P2 family phage contractile tail tube protein